MPGAITFAKKDDTTKRANLMHRAFLLLIPAAAAFAASGCIVGGASGAPYSQAAWTLNLPLPFVDMVALYQLDSNGQWTVQRAGDTLPHSEWRTKGLYPDFDLQINGDAPHDVYLQVRNFKQVGLPIRLATGQQRDGQRQVELLSLGLMLGALLSLAALSILRYLEHRKAIDGWASLFGLLVAATIAQISGVLNAFLWSNVPELGNLASSTLPVIAVGCALLFIRNVFPLVILVFIMRGHTDPYTFGPVLHFFTRQMLADIPNQ